ncbi:unnamed protein product [Peronospora destructor]|uniref:Uncharacterized protein n=1 Tax=Peronospora destructor TaxID=86335 RepID=A0AAV0T303_9STRA|nr:unnamed protein product [Peronospora destructor]
MTPEQLFDNPMFHWWIDYMEYFCNQSGGENQQRYFVKEVFGSSDGLEKLRTEYNTPENKEFAKKVLTELLNERIIEESDSTVIEKSGLTVIEKELMGLDDKIAT